MKLESREDARLRRARFGVAVTAILGTDSLIKASLRTGVSREYIREMSLGAVIPQEQVILDFCTGYGVDPEPLLILAGLRTPEVSAAAEHRDAYDVPDQATLAAVVNEAFQRAVASTGASIADRGEEGSWDRVKARLQLVRMIEKQSGDRYLPDDFDDRLVL